MRIAQSLEEPTKGLLTSAASPADLNRFQDNVSAPSGRPSIDATEMDPFPASPFRENGRDIGQGDEMFAADIDHVGTSCAVVVGLSVKQLHTRIRASKKGG